MRALVVVELLQAAEITTSSQEAWGLFARVDVLEKRDFIGEKTARR